MNIDSAVNRKGEAGVAQAEEGAEMRSLMTNYFIAIRF
jgi:hypothetical protein